MKNQIESIYEYNQQVIENSISTDFKLDEYMLEDIIDVENIHINRNHIDSSDIQTDLEIELKILEGIIRYENDVISKSKIDEYVVDILNVSTEIASSVYTPLLIEEFYEYPLSEDKIITTEGLYKAVI